MISRPAPSAPRQRRRLLPTLVAGCALALALPACGTRPVADAAPSSSNLAHAGQPTPSTTSGSTAVDGSGGADAADTASARWRPLGEPGVGGWVTDVAIDPFDADHLLVGGDLIGVGVSDDGGATWQTTSGLDNPEIGRFTFDPARAGTVWVATMGGPYRSNDGGHTWAARREGFPAIDAEAYSAPIDKVLYDPADANHLLAFGGSHREWEALGKPAWGAVWESRNGGDSWSRLATVAGGANLVDATWLTDGTLLVAALDLGVYRSTDAGRSWAKSSSGLPHADVRALAAQPGNPATVWVALGAAEPASGGGDAKAGGVWRSDDGGRSWRAASSGLDRSSTFGRDVVHTARYHTLVVARSAPNVLYTANQAWGSEGIYRSDDGGESWVEVLGPIGVSRPVTAFGTPVSAEALAVDPADPGHVLIGNAELLLQSRDGGRSWTDAASHLQDDGTLAGNGYTGFVASRVVFDPAHPGRVGLCAFDGGNLLYSADGGRGWRRPLAEFDSWGGCSDLAVGPTGNWWALLGQGGSFNGIARFDPSQGTFDVAFGAGRGLPERWSSVSSLGGITVSGDAVLATIDGRLYRSTDDGRHWTEIHPSGGPEDDSPDGDGPELGPLVTMAGHPNVVLVGGARGVWRSEDRGATFSFLAGSPGRASRLAAAPDGTVYAAVWRTEASGLFQLAPGGGAGWRRLSEAAAVFDVAVDPAAPGHLLVALNDHPYHDRISSGGVAESNDGGRSWHPRVSGLALPRIATIAFDPATPGRVIAGSFGRGFWESGIAG